MDSSKIGKLKHSMAVIIDWPGKKCRIYLEKAILIAMVVGCNQLVACRSAKSPVISNSNKVYYLSDRDTVYKEVDVLPEFISGKEARLTWLRRNVKMPAVTELFATFGDVVCEFVVKKDGTLTDARCVSSPDVYLKKEVMRNIPFMEKWTPGMIDGKPVNTLYTMTISFSKSGCLSQIEFK